MGTDIEEAVKQGNNLFMTGSLAVLGSGLFPEYFRETEWIDRGDAIILTLLSITVSGWYLSGKNRFRGSFVPFGLLIVALVTRTAGLSLETGDPDAAGDEFGVTAPPRDPVGVYSLFNRNFTKKSFIITQFEDKQYSSPGPGPTQSLFSRIDQLLVIPMQSQHFPLNTRFKPSPAMTTWFRALMAMILGLILLVSYVPVALFADMPPVFSVGVLGLTAIVYILLWIWVGLYYESMSYELREDEVNWKRGVWFRTTGIVPYNRITNLDVRQGPLMRALGISSLAIQTAGYSGQAVP